MNLSVPSIKPDILSLLPSVDTVIFDVDGVLLDTSQSIRKMNLEVIPAYLRMLGCTASDNLVASDEIERFKWAGGFNDDWDLSCALILLFLFKSVRYGTKDADAVHPMSPTVEEFTKEIFRRGGWLHAAEAILFEQATPAEEHLIRDAYDQTLIHRLCQEIYAGDLSPRIHGYEPIYFPGPGKVLQDRPILDVSLLPQNKTLALLTGRTRSEAEIAVEMIGIGSYLRFPEFAMTRTDGNAKPDPDGLRRLLALTGARVALYIGDAVDDLRTVLRFSQLPEAESVVTLSAQVLTGTTGVEAAQLFAEADIIAPDVNAILRLL